ncbi:MAG: S46 family peptidase [Planctomycetota bacterium]|jgi:hypothetical protein
MKQLAFSRIALLLVAPFLATALSAQAHKELGRMWTFENAPLGWFQEAYDFSPTVPWLLHAQLSSLRLGDEKRSFCSASFVSPHGLIMTNHHCARDAVSKAQGKRDLLRDGFYAGDFDAELKLEGLRVHQLLATKDVTKEVQGGAKLDELVLAMPKREGVMHQGITLYQGGMFQIYTYKVWDDLRLVCVPHLQSAHFGGDADNFCFPRFGLDFSFLRAYVGGKPADTKEHFFSWKSAGAAEDELVFVTGNPGSTGRQLTVAQCEFQRDTLLPVRLADTKKQLTGLYEQAKDAELERTLRAQILGLENTRKALQGYLDGLRNPKIMAIKQTAEANIRKAIAARPELLAKYGDAWDKVEAVIKKRQALPADATDSDRKVLADAEAVVMRQIGEAWFAVYGTQIPPDATMSLRLSDGIVKGFEMNGTKAPCYTSLYGLFARHTEFAGQHPFDLPQAWLDACSNMDLTTPFNFVTTNDIIGGNSGSPMIDKEQHVVGLIFDGNIESLGNRYVFDDEVARTVSVHPAIIIEALRKVYGAGKLAEELEGTNPANKKMRAKKAPIKVGAGG